MKFEFGRLSSRRITGPLLLAQEVLQKQIAEPQLDVSEHSLESHEHYSVAGYKALKTLLDKLKHKAEGEVRTVYTDDSLQSVVGILESNKLHLYK